MNKNSYLKPFNKITIVGGGMTGRAVVKTLSDTGVELFLTDKGTISERTHALLDSKEVNYEEGNHTDEALRSDLLVVSPGVPPDSYLLKEAGSRGIPVIGEIELAYRLSPCETTVAVTGTNGKTTTVKLISALLDWAGENSVACGNIGTPFIKVVNSLDPSDIPVVEVSSYQLQHVKDFKPEIAVLLNIEPDHLKRHGTFENYRETKLKIFQNQRENDCALINKNIDLLDRVPGSSEKVEFSRRKLQEIGMAPHQMENLGAATGVLECIFGDSPGKIPEDVVKPILHVPHRLEKVASTGGITIINDSKATNPSATLAALSSLEKPINLLLGGKKKKGGYRELAASLKESGVIRVHMFGSGRRELQQVLVKENFERFEVFESMEQATREAFSAASAGEVILLSPACSSFDAFSDFEERGNVFKEIVTKHL